MMNKRAVLFLIVSLVLGIQPAHAMVTGNGVVNFSWGVTPGTSQSTYTDGRFGYLSYYNYSTHSESFPWAPQGTVYLNNALPRTDGYSSLTGTALSNGGSAFEAVYQTPDGATTSALGNVDFYGRAQFFNFPSSMIFPAFSYDYDFAGTTDSANDHLQFVLQFELKYYTFYENPTTGILNTRYYTVYSDYCVDPGCREKMLQYTLNGEGEIREDGTVSFDAVIASVPDGEAFGGWLARWDVGGGFIDRDENPEAPQAVPEPMSLVLLGAGALGAFARRRRSL